MATSPAFLREAVLSRPVRRACSRRTRSRGKGNKTSHEAETTFFSKPRWRWKKKSDGPYVPTNSPPSRTGKNHRRWKTSTLKPQLDNETRNSSRPVTTPGYSIVGCSHLMPAQCRTSRKRCVERGIESASHAGGRRKSNSLRFRNIGGTAWVGNPGRMAEEARVRPPESTDGWTRAEKTAEGQWRLTDGHARCRGRKLPQKLTDKREINRRSSQSFKRGGS